MSVPDEVAFVRAAQAGDPAGLGALLVQHRARLHAVAASMLGHGPQVEDAVHDTFLVALGSIGSLRDPAAARPWLLSIIRNVCRMQLRRPAELVTDPAELPPVPSGAVEDSIEQAVLRDWVWAALERLPESQRLVTVLRYFTRASTYDAIAEVCGIPIGTVRSRLNAARLKLADELLRTAAGTHSDAAVHQRRAADVGAVMADFERTGDRRGLREVFAPDLRFSLADRIPRQGLQDYASALASDFQDGISTRLINTVAGADLAVAEMWLDSPPDHPRHCPPAMTQVMFHNGHTTRRIVCYYAHQPPPEAFRRGRP